MDAPWFMAMMMMITQLQLLLLFGSNACAFKGIAPSSLAHDRPFYLYPYRSFSSSAAPTTAAATTAIPVIDCDWKVLPDIWPTLAALIPNQVMLSDYIHSNSTAAGSDITYAEFHELVSKLSAAMVQRFGYQPSTCTAIFAENSCRWLITEQAVMLAGGYNAVRGASASISELVFILQHSQAKALVVETSDLLIKLADSSEFAKELLSSLQFVIILYGDKPTAAAAETNLTAINKNILSFEELLQMSRSLPSVEKAVKHRNSSEIATVIYTSGTTNRAKGVMLTHANLIYQIKYSSFSKLPLGSSSLDPQ
jgi:long-chain acyl-CoA synthetase